MEHLNITYSTYVPITNENSSISSAEYPDDLMSHLRRFVYHSRVINKRTLIDKSFICFQQLKKPVNLECLLAKNTCGENTDRIGESYRELPNFGLRSLSTYENNICSFLYLDNQTSRPDHILIGFFEGEIIIHSLEHDASIMEYDGHMKGVGGLKSIEYYKAGMFLSTGWDGFIKVWDFQHRNAVKLYENAFPIYAIDTLFPSHNSMFITGDYSGALNLWSFKSLKCTKVQTDSKSIFNIEHFKTEAYSDYCLSASSVGEISLIDLNSFNKIFTYHSEDHAQIIDIKIYKNDLFMTSGFDNRIQIWSLLHNRSLKNFMTSEGYLVTAVIFSELDIVVSTHDTNTIMILDLLDNTSQIGLDCGMIIWRIQRCSYNNFSLIAISTTNQIILL